MGLHWVAVDACLVTSVLLLLAIHCNCDHSTRKSSTYEILFPSEANTNTNTPQCLALGFRVLTGVWSENPSQRYVPNKRNCANTKSKLNRIFKLDETKWSFVDVTVDEPEPEPEPEPEHEQWSPLPPPPDTRDKRKIALQEREPTTTFVDLITARARTSTEEPPTLETRALTRTYRIHHQSSGKRSYYLCTEREYARTRTIKQSQTTATTTTTLRLLRARRDHFKDHNKWQRSCAWRIAAITSVYTVDEKHENKNDPSLLLDNHKDNHIEAQVEIYQVYLGTKYRLSTLKTERWSASIQVGFYMVADIVFDMDSMDMNDAEYLYGEEQF